MRPWAKLGPNSMRRPCPGYGDKTPSPEALNLMQEPDVTPWSELSEGARKLLGGRPILVPDAGLLPRKPGFPDEEGDLIHLWFGDGSRS